METTSTAEAAHDDAPLSATGSPEGESRNEQKAFAWKMIGFFIGAALLCGCAATVTYLPEWGQRVGLPWVFLGFTLIMLLASHLAVAGGQALWRTLRSSDV